MNQTPVSYTEMDIHEAFIHAYSFLFLLHSLPASGENRFTLVTLI